MSQGDRPRGRDARIVAHLVAGRTASEAATEVGVSVSTIHRTRARWHDTITEERDALAEQVAAEMLALVPAAVNAYRDLVTSNVPGIRLAAARDVVGHALRWRDATEVERRLAALEASTPAPQPRQPWEAA